MNNLDQKRLFFVIENLVLLGCLGFLLYWHFLVGQTRFFDVDEFTHLHWAANMARGQKPYIDFFTFFTPGFYWMLEPLFWIFGRSVAIFTAARTLMFFVFVGTVALTGWLFTMLRDKRYVLIPMILLAFLPMPYDKFMEIRPDNPATLLGLAGVVLEVWAIIHPSDKKKGKAWLGAGASYAVSLILLVKTLPFVAMGCLVALWDAGVFWWVGECVKKKHVFPLRIDRAYWLFLIGLAAPAILTLLWMLTLGNFSTVWYSLTRLPFEANTIGRVYIMEPHLFFFPNASFYGGWGVTRPLIDNHTIWFIALIMGTTRLLTPFIGGQGDKKRVMAEVLVSGIFFLSVVGYVEFFPLKHSQYLIPIAIFIAWYAADAGLFLFSWIKKYAGEMGLVIFFIVLAVILGQDIVQINQTKMATSNAVQLAQTNQLLSSITPGQQVLDLDGRLMFWTDPYYICCLPFGSFVRFLSRPPVPVSDVLETKKVAYIYQGDSGRLWELWGDLPYIQSHYSKVPGWGDTLWKRNN